MQRPPSSQVPRDHVILLLVNLTLPAPTQPPAAVPCQTQLVGVDAQTTSLDVDNTSLPDVWLDFAHQVHAWQLPQDGTPQGGFGISGLNFNQTAAGASGCLTFRRCVLAGLSQGPAAAGATSLRTPDLWTLLLWPLQRWAQNWMPTEFSTLYLYLCLWTTSALPP
jgi:hypothetical protein